MSEKERARLDRAYQIFREAVERVPAYPRFLDGLGVDSASVTSPDDFGKLPVADKDSYLRAYPLSDLCLGGSLEGMHAVYRSAGTTGEPLFWPRLPEEEQELPRRMAEEFRFAFRTDRRHTLVLVALPLGSWLRGGETTWATHAAALASEGGIACATPGDDPDEVLRVIETLGPHFAQMVLLCYPPRLLPLLDAGDDRGVDWKTMSVRIAFIGESVSEEWRTRVGGRLGLTESELLATWGSYGGTETGRVGRETPFTVLLRRRASESPALCEELFGRAAPPFLCERDPAAAQVEVVGGELVFTKRQAVPLVRYNIHDRGAILSRHRVLDVCRSHGLDLAADLGGYGFGAAAEGDAPLLAVYGRSTGAVRFLGVEIRPEDVSDAIKRSALRGRFAGRLVLRLDSGHLGEPRLVITAELADGVVPDVELAHHFGREIVKGLRESSPAFTALCERIDETGGRCEPDVDLRFFGDPDLEIPG